MIWRDRLVRYWPELAVACGAVFIAWCFAYTTLGFAREMGLPLDDSYIYLNYAKHLGRGEPFAYFPGGGYTAGATSPLWPLVLAPFWALGARGHALVWVAFVVCTALYAVVAIGCCRVARERFGTAAGLAAALIVLACAPLAWTCLSGMEVALASALVVATAIAIARVPASGPPPRHVGALLAATALARPEATLLVAATCVAIAVARARAKELRAAAWWLAPLAAPAAWMLANRVSAGHLFPNTGVAKSYFYLPGFDWTFWWSSVTTFASRAFAGLLWNGGGPLAWPRLVLAAWLVGAVRVALWAHRERRYVAGALIVLAPIAMMLAVVVSSGAWDFQNYRYSAPALPLVGAVAACGIAPPGRLRGTWIGHAWGVAIVAVAGARLVVAWPAMREDMRLYAQDVVDLDAQVVTIGRYLNAKLPDATVMFHDAGAIAYYGDTRGYDMLGLVTNYQADIANNGPGARFEFLESLPPERRPTHFAYYRVWLGQEEFFGTTVLHTPLGAQFSSRRLVGEYDMELIEATWDHAHSAERPITPHDGWALVDRVDVADLESERAHGWEGKLGRRQVGNRSTARWSFVSREVGEHGLLVDGGRVIREGGERFEAAIDPGKPVRVIVRSGGRPEPELAGSAPVTLRLVGEAGEPGEVRVVAPRGPFVELAFDLPAQHVERAALRVDASGPYQVFHWFVLQPE